MKSRKHHMKNFSHFSRLKLKNLYSNGYKKDITIILKISLICNEMTSYYLLYCVISQVECLAITFFKPTVIFTSTLSNMPQISMTKRKPCLRFFVINARESLYAYIANKPLAQNPTTKIRKVTSR